MANSKENPNKEQIITNIFRIRGVSVMIDRDLAMLYGVKTKVLKQSVKRNLERFPQDFMFQMSVEEFKNWRSQIVTSNSPEKMGLRYIPFCFTELGVAMLSSVLSSQTAILMNIEILRAFSAMKKALLTNQEILLKLALIENQLESHETGIKDLFEALRLLIQPPSKPRERIGFKPEY